jgi:hypothetical protein
MSILSISSLFRPHNSQKKSPKSLNVLHIQQQKALAPNNLTAIKADTFEASDTKSGHTGWVEIPSKNHDSNNFDSNLRTLNLLWNYKWDKPYYTGYGQDLGRALNENDFHIYYENGKSVMALRMNDDKKPVQIYGFDDKVVPIKYSSLIKEQVKKAKDTDYSLFY